MPRPDGRRPNELRPLKLTPDFIGSADGSVLIELGRTRVVCTATVERSIRPWLRGTGRGWITAEYGMLPASTGERHRRPGASGPDSRAVEIRRLIGRALRAAIDAEALGECTVTVDCDVLEADGGTRTAAITGGWVALVRALAKAQAEGRIHPPRDPVIEQVVAVSCGMVGGRAMLDLAYAEDSTAEADCNVAMTPDGRLIDVQATAERGTLRASHLARLVKLAAGGIQTLAKAQARAVQHKRRA
jgi:ribonuclease PH